MAKQLQAIKKGGKMRGIVFTETDQRLLAMLRKKYPSLNDTDLVRMAIHSFAKQEGVAA